MFCSRLKFSQRFQNATAKRYKSFTIRKLRAKVNTAGQKNESGDSIKRLNAENKRLFGGLLETRSQRIQRLAQPGEMPNFFTMNNVKDDTFAEFACFTKLAKNHTAEKKEPKLKNVYKGRGEIGGVTPLRSGNNYESSNSVLSLSNKDGVKSTVECSKTTSIQLPNIIVRNIPSFRLVNDVKVKHLEIENRPNNILSFSLEDYKDQKHVIAYPSVTRILNETMSDASLAALKQWKERMILELGEEGFKKYQKDLLANGAQFHSVVQSFLSGTPEEDLVIDPQLEGCWQSLSAVIPTIENVQVIESHVVHTTLMYRGVIDCVAYYRGKPVLIEWKKSDKQKPELEKTYDAPIQMTAYLGALNFDNHYNFQLKQGLVVVAYTDGSPANVFPVNVADCLKYWRIWLLRLHKYWLQQNQLKEKSQAV